MVSIESDNRALTLTASGAAETPRFAWLTAFFGGREWLWFICGLGVSVLWLLSAMAYLAHNFGTYGFAGMAPPEIAMVVTAIFIPLVALWLIIGYGRQSEENRRQVRFLDRRLKDIKSSDAQRLRQAEVAAESLEGQAVALRMASAFALQQIHEAETQLATHTDELYSKVREAEARAEAQASRMEKHGQTFQKALEQFAAERAAIEEMMGQLHRNIDTAGEAARKQVAELTDALDEKLLQFRQKLDDIVASGDTAATKLEFQTDALQAATDHAVRKGEDIADKLATKSSGIASKASEVAQRAHKIIADMDAGAGRLIKSAENFYEAAKRSDDLVSARTSQLSESIAKTHAEVDAAGTRFQSHTQELGQLAETLAGKFDAAHEQLATKLSTSQQQLSELEDNLNGAGERLDREMKQLETVRHNATQHLDSMGETLQTKSQLMENLVEELADKTAAASMQSTSLIESTESNIEKLDSATQAFIRHGDVLKSDAHDMCDALATAGRTLVAETETLNEAASKTQENLAGCRSEIQDITVQGEETVTAAANIRTGIEREIERLNRLSDTLESRADVYLETAKERDATFSGLSQQLSEGLDSALATLDAAAARSKETATATVEDITAASAKLAGNADQVADAAATVAAQVTAEAGKLDERIDQFAEAGGDTTTALLAAAERISSHTGQFASDIAAIKSTVDEVDLYAEQFANRIDTHRQLLEGAAVDTEKMLDSTLSLFAEGSEQLSAQATQESQRMADAGQLFADAAEAMARVADESQRDIRTATDGIGQDLNKVETTVAQMSDRLERIEDSAATARTTMAREQTDLEQQVRALTETLQDQARDIEAVSQRVSGTAKLVGLTFRQQTKDLLDASKSAKRQYERLQAVQTVEPGHAFVDRLTEITDALNSTGIDLSKAMEGSLPEDIWQQYLDGDRGVIARRIQHDKSTYGTRQIRAHYEKDSHFREAANRYLNQFERLLDEIAARDPEEMISIVFLTSDVGKIYLLLCRALNRHS